MIDIRNHNLFKTTALKSVVKASLFCFEKAKASLAVDSNAHSNEVWLAYTHLLDYMDPRSSGLFRLVPTSLDNRGSTVVEKPSYDWYE